MAEAVIGALRVNLGVNTAQFSRDLSTAEARMKRFNAVMVTAGAVIGAAIGAAVIKLGVAIKNVIDKADGFNKLSQKIGVSVEALSGLSYAAELSDVSIDQLSTGLVKFNKYLAETGQGSVDVQGALLTVADRFAAMEDGADKTALAVQLFGRAGADLIPMLNLGAEGLRKMFVEADNLGVIIDTKTAVAAEQFNDNLTRLSNVAGGFAVQLTAALAPSLASFTDAIIEAKEKASEFDFSLLDIIKHGGLAGYVIGRIFFNTGEIDKATDAIKAQTSALPELYPEWVKLNADVVIATKAQVAATEAMQSAGKALSAALNPMEAYRQKLAEIAALEAAGSIDAETAAKAKAKAAIDLTSAQNSLNASIGAALTPMEAYRAKLSEIIALESTGIITTEAAGRARLQAAIDLADATKALQDEATERTRTAASATLDLAHAQDAAAASVGLSLTPLDAYARKLQEIAVLEQTSQITAQQAGAARVMAAATTANAYGALLGTVGQALGTLFEDNKAVAIAQALINTYQGITAALAQYPPPFSYAMAAAQAALGFAQVAAIKRTRPGSSGGTTATAATGGKEKASSGGGGTTNAMQRSVNVTVVGEAFGPEHMRGLIDQLNVAIGDGKQLITVN